MKIFLDTAHIPHIKEAMTLGFLDGVTTNPTLIAKEGRTFDDTIRQICEICPGPISAECVTETHAEMVPEARRLAKLARNVVVKVPLTKEGLKTIRTVSQEGIKINTTLCFTPIQALFAARAGAAYISPFVGRLDDAGTDGMQVIRDIKTIYDNYAINTEILVASIRGVGHVLEAARIGAHISTMPFNVYESLIRHPLTDQGVARFLEDYKKIPKQP